MKTHFSSGWKMEMVFLTSFIHCTVPKWIDVNREEVGLISLPLR